ncbi:hypothetical protein GCM10011529_10460 [Polymorphobacter glacialis]|uniref:Uncharacterized protein n=1 Tax=Sandarakinorhabdus glacialis TaxID=1614636 RepID=A0A917E790_9SPHN|nr:hypothetical protein [Polymorphobacter glacialis]GGE05992.1 hypothetical protein GCM10011529_10460 [Polymorphobacter glacialis]
MSLLLSLLLASAVPVTPANYASPAMAEKPDDIAADSMRDLKDSRYYNKAGATRADYDHDWQECRLIARGSKTPGGSSVVVYNPAIISPAAAAGGGIIGAMIGQAIVEGQVRRANRRSCLMFRGWRLVEVSDADESRFALMPETEREALFITALGVAEPVGKSVTTWTNVFAEMPVLAAKEAK